MPDVPKEPADGVFQTAGCRLFFIRQRFCRLNNISQRNRSPSCEYVFKYTFYMRRGAKRMDEFDRLITEQLKTMDKLLFLQGEIERCQEIEQQLRSLQEMTELETIREADRRCDCLLPIRPGGFILKGDKEPYLRLFFAGKSGKPFPVKAWLWNIFTG